MRRSTIYITRLAMLLSLLLLLQYLTAPTHQLITGSLVNLIIVLAVLAFDDYGAIGLALISPFAAFLFGIGPMVFPLVPMIALGNVVFVIAWILAKRIDPKFRFWYLFLPLTAVAKFITLYFLVVLLALPLFIDLPDAKEATIAAMFTFPQLLTALIGGALGLVMAVRVKPLIEHKLGDHKRIVE